MPDMVQTPDGRRHYLVSSLTLSELVRQYAGDEVAELVRRLETRNAYEETAANNDAAVYEEELNELTLSCHIWADELETIAALAAKKNVTKAMLAAAIRGTAKNINNCL